MPFLKTMRVRTGHEDVRTQQFRAINEELKTHDKILFASDWDKTLSARHMYRALRQASRLGMMGYDLNISPSQRRSLYKHISEFYGAVSNRKISYDAYHKAVESARGKLQTFVNELHGPSQNKYSISQICAAFDLVDPRSRNRGLKNQSISRVKAFIGLMSMDQNYVEMTSFDQLIKHPTFQEYFPETTQQSIGAILKTLETKPNMQMAIVSHGTTPKLILACLYAIAETQGVNFNEIKNRIICDNKTVMQYEVSQSKYQHLENVKKVTGESNTLFVDDSLSTLEGTADAYRTQRPEIQVMSISAKLKPTGVNPTANQKQANSELWIRIYDDELELSPGLLKALGNTIKQKVDRSNVDFEFDNGQVLLESAYTQGRTDPRVNVTSDLLNTIQRLEDSGKMVQGSQELGDKINNWGRQDAKEGAGKKISTFDNSDFSIYINKHKGLYLSQNLLKVLINEHKNIIGDKEKDMSFSIKNGRVFFEKVFEEVYVSESFKEPLDVTELLLKTIQRLEDSGQTVQGSGALRKETNNSGRKRTHSSASREPTPPSREGPMVFL